MIPEEIAREFGRLFLQCKIYRGSLARARARIIYIRCVLMVMQKKTEHLMDIDAPFVIIECFFT